MPPRNEKPPKVERHPLVEALNPNPADPPRPTVKLFGLPGSSTSDEHTRLWLDGDLTSYVDVPTRTFFTSRRYRTKRGRFCGSRPRRNSATAQSALKIHRPASWPARSRPLIWRELPLAPVCRRGPRQRRRSRSSHPVRRRSSLSTARKAGREPGLPLSIRGDDTIALPPLPGSNKTTREPAFLPDRGMPTLAFQAVHEPTADLFPVQRYPGVSALARVSVPRHPHAAVPAECHCLSVGASGLPDADRKCQRGRAVPAHAFRSLPIGECDLPDADRAQSLSVVELSIACVPLRGDPLRDRRDMSVGFCPPQSIACGGFGGGFGSVE